MPHRFHRSVLGGDFGRRDARTRGPRDGRARQAAGSARATDWRCCSRRRSTTRRRSRLYQGLPAGHSRERRPVHARGDLVGAGVRSARRRRQGGRAVLDAQPDQPLADPRRTPIATRSSPMSCAPTSIRQPPHVGRGGWTWYTGSAGWLYRAGVESLLGLKFRGAFLLVDPCIPKAWGQYEATVKYRTARYSICVENPGGVQSWRRLRGD